MANDKKLSLHWLSHHKVAKEDFNDGSRDGFSGGSGGGSSGDFSGGSGDGEWESAYEDVEDEVGRMMWEGGVAPPSYPKAWQVWADEKRRESGGDTTD